MKKKKKGKKINRRKRIFWIIGIILALILIGTVLYFLNVSQTALSSDSIPSEVAEIINP